VLIKFAAQAISTYAMSIFKFSMIFSTPFNMLSITSSGVINRKIERSIGLVAQKEDTGLGFSDVDTFNDASLVKQV